MGRWTIGSTVFGTFTQCQSQTKRSSILIQISLLTFTPVIHKARCYVSRLNNFFRTASKSLFKTTELNHCEGTPIKGSLVDHNHNLRDAEDHDNCGGPTPEEIGMLYFKWAMCIKCAEATTENFFSARSKAL